MVYMVYDQREVYVAYFLKKQGKDEKMYLAIYESFYDAKRKNTAHRCIRGLGSVKTLKGKGIKDPLNYFQKEVDRMNLERETSVIKIQNKTPLKNLGYFLLKSVLDKLEIKKFIDLYKYNTDFHFDLYEVLTALIYSRVIKPCSKSKTFEEVIPTLFGDYDFSYDQLLDALKFYGHEYKKIIELFNSRVNEVFGLDTDKTYFDCTNFYFEIDKEDELRRKGPSKENRSDPIVGMGLLLDNNIIPIAMTIYPGNQSEKPLLKEVIDDLKDKNQIKGKTVHVADKGLNCADNIASAIINHNGYIFSKSVKQLSETEKTWVKLDNDWKEVRTKDGDLYYRYKSCVDEFPYTIIDINGKKKKVNLKEKRLLTYNYALAAKKRHEINRLVEKAKSLSSSANKKSEYGEAAKYVIFKSINENGEVKGKACALLNKEAIEKDLCLAGYNLLVTSEIDMDDIEIYRTYHHLWRIEETFKIMKSDLDARPVYLRLEESIKGHFLICYLAVLLERLIQVKVLENKYSSNTIINFIKDFSVVKASSNTYINITKANKFIDELAKACTLPLDHYYFSESQIKKVLNYKI